MERTQIGQPDQVRQTGAAQRPFAIRPACGADHTALREFLTRLSLRARYLRFFTGAPSASPAMLRILTGAAGDVDAVVATEAGVIIGHAMGCDVTGPGGTRQVEIGVVVADGRRGLGVGSALVRTLIARAQARGATAVAMAVLAENRQVVAMIAGHWPAASYEHSGPCVTIHARLPHSVHEQPPRPQEQPPRPEEEPHGEQLAISR